MSWKWIHFPVMFLFLSTNGAEWAAVIYTLLENAKLKGLEPESLKKIVDYPGDRLEELLPANWERNFGELKEEV
jgi:ferritin-like protein